MHRGPGFCRGCLQGTLLIFPRASCLLCRMSMSCGHVPYLATCEECQRAWGCHLSAIFMKARGLAMRFRPRSFGSAVLPCWCSWPLVSACWGHPVAARQGEHGELICSLVAVRRACRAGEVTVSIVCWGACACFLP